MATDAELLALIGRAPLQTQETTAGEFLPDLDLSLFLSPSAQREIEAAKAQQENLFGLPEMPAPEVLDPFVALATNQVPVVDNPFADFSFSIQEDGYADAVFASELAEPPPPPPVTNMASFPLESLWSLDPTDELEEGPVRGAAARAPVGGLEALFMNHEAREAQQALGIMSDLPPLPPVSRQARDVDIEFGGDIDIDVDTIRTRSWGGRGAADGVVVGRRGSDGRFHQVAPPPPQPERRPFEGRVAAVRTTGVPRAEVYKSPPPPSIETYRSRMSFLNDD